MTDLLDRKRSVTEADKLDAKTGAGVLSVFIGDPWLPERLGLTGNQIGLPPQSIFCRRRDAILSATILMDSMWAAATAKAITRNVALGYTLTDSKDIATRAAHAQDLLDLFDGDFETGIQRHLRDYLHADNGAWVEIIRASNARGAKITGITHLDSLRVQRTGDPEYPAIYRDIQSREHLMRYDQVANLTQLPSSRTELRGLGYCAASVAWDTIVKMQAVEVYFREKVTGARNQAIHLVSGISTKQLESALLSADEEQKRKGYVVYKGSLIVPGLDVNEPPTVTTIPLAEIADGFDVGQERERADNIYANAIGIFVGEIRPLTGQGLGNGQQARILEEAAEGQGLAAWRKQWTTFLRKVLPKTTTFSWSSKDLSDQKRQADIDQVVMGTLTTAVEKSVLSVQEARQILLDKKIIPPEMATNDLTLGGSLTDEEQAPSTEQGQAPGALPALQRLFQPQALQAQKAARKRITAATIAAATRIAEAIDGAEAPARN